MKKELAKSLEVLKNGGVILYPTDTVWGIGCDATNEKAVSKVYSIKKRDSSKAMICLVDSFYMIEAYVQDPPEIAFDLIELSARPLSVVFDNAMGLAENLIADDGSIAFRMVEKRFCSNLISRLRKPLVSTSANFSGETVPQNLADVPETIKSSVDYIVNCCSDTPFRGSVSDLIKISNSGEVKILRSGGEKA